ncbi:hypothetical protein EPI10_030880 [Gossypium australe]|uniref:Tf2-1-like SH3-like domain-containing protein n=1 Tax=Gossypium australe TaxID=47621 RepID=A0A5B6WZX3_9ROSI|nr:hypothetical protein EPI10_030880 [Gossypium australe]
MKLSMVESIKHHGVGQTRRKKNFDSKSDRLKSASNRQKSYANLKRKDIEHSVGDQRVSPVAYQVELPLELDRIHDVFHVSMLRRYQSDPSHIVPIEEIDVRPDFSFDDESLFSKFYSGTMTLRRPHRNKKKRFVNNILICLNQENFDDEIFLRRGELSHPKI